MTDTSANLTASRPGALSEGFDLGRLLLKGRAFFALIAIIIVFSILSPYYFSLGNFLTMSSHVAIFGILAIGMLLVILNGGIDLSVGSTLGFCGVVAGFLMQGVTLKVLGVVLYPAVWVVVVLAVALGGFVGLVNGVLIARFKVPAFVATLGVMYVVRGLALLMTNGLTYNNLGGEADRGNTGFNWLGFNRLLEGGVKVFDSSIALVRELRRKGIKVGLATSSKNGTAILSATRTTDLFDTVVDGDVSERLGLKDASGAMVAPAAR